MGDIRFDPHLSRLVGRADAADTIRNMDDDAVVQALAAAARAREPYLANVLATEALNRLRRSAAVAAHIGEGVYTTDEAGRITSLNPAGERILGHSQLDLLGRSAEETIHGHTGAVCPADDVLGRRLDVARGEGTFLRGDGSRIEVSYVAAPILADAEIEGSVVAFRDATEERRARETRRFLSGASEALAASLDYEETLQKVAEFAVPSLADGCAVDMLEGDRLRLVAVAHADPAMADLARAIRARWPARLDSTKGIGRVVATGRSELLPQVDASFLEQVARDAEHLEMLRRLHVQSLMIVPLATRGRMLGALTLVSAESGRRFDEADLRTAEDLARRSALAVENARAHAELRARERLQGAVARLGQAALSRMPLDDLLDEAVRIVADSLSVEYASVLELLPDGQDLRLRAGVGWRGGLVGAATVSAGPDSQAGRTLVADEPVIFEDLRREERFRGPPLLVEHGVVSGMSVIIQGEGKPFGVLGAHTTRERRFTEHDVHFLQGVANVLAEAILRRRSEDRYDSLFEHNPDGVFAIDAEGRFLGVNPAGQRLSGYATAELVGQPFAPLLAEEDLERALANFQRVLSGEAVSTEYTILRKDGTRRRFAITAVPMRIGGRVSGLYGIAQDVTERVRMEDELRRAKETLERRVRERTVELEALNREMEAFSYSVSHDLRAPLRGIDAFSRALAEEYRGSLPPEARDLVDRLASESERLTLLVNDLLTLSRVTAGELRRESVDLSSLAEEVIRELRRAEPERRVETFVEPGLVANGDRRLLRVVLENLISNAWKFTRRAEDPRIAVRGRRDDGRTVISVSDTGAGFDPSKADDLFRPFRRLHTSEEYEGSGIGLATVKRVIERHGGKVWAEGRRGQGATFSFDLR